MHLSVFSKQALAGGLRSKLDQGHAVVLLLFAALALITGVNIATAPCKCEISFDFSTYIFIFNIAKISNQVYIRFNEGTVGRPRTDCLSECITLRELCKRLIQED